jgi:tetratricopeptide (TPR) repeat protein
LPRRPLPVLSLLLVTAACATGARVPDGAGAAVQANPERHAYAAAIGCYLSARLSESSGDPAGAVEALGAALVQDPDSPQLHVAYAEALARAGRVERAESEARRGVDLSQAGTAAATDAHLALGKVLALSGRTRAALDELETATRSEAALARGNPDDEEDASFDPEPWRALARVRLQAGDVPGAVAACDALGELDPAEGAAGLREVAGKLLDAKKPEASRDLLRRSVELAPAEVDGWKLLAGVEEGRERFADARAAWERALAVEPDDPDALLAAGRLALHDGDFAKGRARFADLIAVSSNESAARIRIAAAWLDAKRPADALAATGGGDDPRLLYLRGMALEVLRRWREAADAFARVEPASGDLYSSARVGLAHALMRSRRPADAVRAARQGLAAHPADPELMYVLGEAYDRAGQRDAALAQMRSVLAVKADHSEALNYLGYSYAERGERLDEAQELLERALKIEPENGYYLDSLGWVYFKKGDLERALKALERADALVGPEPTILEHLGDCYRAASRPGEAAAAYRRALDVSGKGSADPEVEAPGRASVERKLRELGRREVRPAIWRHRDKHRH